MIFTDSYSFKAGSFTALGAENCLAAGVNWPSFFTGLFDDSTELRTIPIDQRND